MSYRSRAGLALTLVLVGAATGCASSRSLLNEPELAGGSERFVRAEEEVFQAALNAVDEVGLRVDEVVEWPGGGQAVLASRGWSLWDYGAIARVIVEPASMPEEGTWVRVTSQLKMSTNLAGKSDYREEVLEGIYGALASDLARPADLLPAPSLTARVTDPLEVGTRLRIGGVRGVVTASDATGIIVDERLGAPPARLTLDELAASPNVERLIREPYRTDRLLIGTLGGAALGALMWLSLGSDPSPYAGTVGAVYAATGVVSGILLGAVWGGRGRVQWRPMP